MGEKWSTDGVVMDSYDRSAATANVKHMLRIMDQAATPNKANDIGFDEERMVNLYRYWLIVGSWMRTPEYAKIYGPPMAMLRAPRPATGGAKYSALLHAALKQLAHFSETNNDTKQRRSVFDLAQDRMQDFLYAFHTALAKQSQISANAFRQKLQAIPDYVRVHYTKHWS
jgi:hypothetical protein